MGDGFTQQTCPTCQGNGFILQEIKPSTVPVQEGNNGAEVSLDKGEVIQPAKRKVQNGLQGRRKRGA